ncbi:MAG: thiol-disulfide isomerase/thioredoxin, partial [Saprospiraceae bacterium]
MKIRFSILLLLFSFNLYSQLPDGAIAPNITFTDIDGNTHTLYDILDEGKSVVFDVMATWCGPCWSYQNTGILENLYEEYGPDGTDEIEIFMVESSTSTNEACLYGPSGCSGGTYGNWTAGILYPIVHITGSNGSNFNNIFNINYFPTLYKVCPNRKIYEVGQSSLSTWENWVTSCNLDATELVNNVICYGQGESLIDLTIEGGYGNITYSWSNGANSQDLIGVPSGDYSCTITEGQGHEIEIGPYTIDGPSSPLFVDIVNQNNVSCAGYNNGYILTSSSGGGNNYSYQWDNGANTQNLNNISGGLYTLSVTDSYGCTETVSTSITEPPLLTLGTQPINENCEQGNGIILLFANGGQGTYLYDIGQGQTSEDVISNLSAGTYSATVTDENGCASFSVAIIENEAGPVAEAGNTGLIACNQEIINLSGSGSSSGNEIIYLWETLDGNIISGANTLDPEVDEVGTYTLNVINVLTGCQTTDEVLVEGDLNAPESEAGEEASLTCIVETVSLDGSNSSQGNEFEYQWLNENGEEISTEIIVDTDQAGTYELVVT